MNKGNVSKEYADQRIRDSPLRKLQKSCTRQTQDPLFENPEKEEQEDGCDREAD